MYPRTDGEIYAFQRLSPGTNVIEDSAGIVRCGPRYITNGAEFSHSILELGSLCVRPLHDMQRAFVVGEEEPNERGIHITLPAVAHHDGHFDGSPRAHLCQQRLELLLEQCA